MNEEKIASTNRISLFGSMIRFLFKHELVKMGDKSIIPNVRIESMFLWSIRYTTAREIWKLI